MHQIGLSPKAVNWFKSYLYKRTMYTEINGTLSATCPVGVGVPQGTVLGPLLYLIYSYDMKCISKGIYNFADDTSILGVARPRKSAQP